MFDLKSESFVDYILFEPEVLASQKLSFHNGMILVTLVTVNVECRESLNSIEKNLLKLQKKMNRSHGASTML